MCEYANDLQDAGTPPIDLEVLAVLDDPDDSSFLVQLIDLFLADASSLLAALAAAASRGDLSAADQAAHGLKGSSASMGAQSLAELCRRCLIAARDRGEGLADLVPQVEREVSRVAAAMLDVVADRR